MRKKICLSVSVCIAVLTLSGCWSAREINQLLIVTAMGFDKAEDDKILLSIQAINPTEVSPQQGPTTRTAITSFRTEGDTVFEALRKLTLEVPRRAYVSHIRIVVIGEELAREGIDRILDVLYREHEFRSDFYLVVAKNEKAEKVMNILSSLEKISSNKMFFSLNTSSYYWGSTTRVELNEMIDQILSRGREPVLTGIRIKGDPKTGNRLSNVEHVDAPTTLQYTDTGLAVFRRDKLIGWLNEKESIAYNFAAGNINDTVLNIPCKNGNVALEIERAEEQSKARFTAGRPEIDLTVKAEASVKQVQCAGNLSLPQTIYDLETRAQKKLHQDISEVIARVQKEYKADIFGFGETIRRSEPSQWEKLKKEWEKTFADLKVNVRTDIKIRGTGTVGESFIHDFEEYKE